MLRSVCGTSAQTRRCHPAGRRNRQHFTINAMPCPTHKCLSSSCKMTINSSKEHFSYRLECVRCIHDRGEVSDVLVHGNNLSLIALLGVFSTRLPNTAAHQHNVCAEPDKNPQSCKLTGCFTSVGCSYLPARGCVANAIRGVVLLRETGGQKRSVNAASLPRIQS